jgi:PhzF family phenazine biosynthesis protein
MRPFRQVDVFTSTPGLGNPVAVVHEADGLSDVQMRRFARWTNLSETTFVLAPRLPEADYRVRIFTPTSELPFAGHPTIGTALAWLESGGVPKASEEIVQECAAGAVRVRRVDGRLSFAAPPLLREGPVDEVVVGSLARQLGIGRDEIVDSQWVDNGPGWVAVLLPSAEAVLALRPSAVEMDIGAVGPYPPGSEAAFEVRAFSPKVGAALEDPVTGSLNASLAPWLVVSGRVTLPYVASQGAALGRAGRVYLSGDAAGTVWVGGDAVTWIAGEVDL